ncbi:LUD domain-containing protein [candidate division KSB1 bacterium]|nr:LUD domain-containing protein [candidate division KSB1 bacterium]
MNSSRDKILNAVKEAVKIPSRIPEKPEGINAKIAESLKSITPKDYAGLRDQFAKELDIVSGEFVLVKSASELVSHLSGDMKSKNFTSLAVSDEISSKNIASHIKKELPELEFVFPADLAPEQKKNKLAKTSAALVNIDFAVADVASLAVLIDNTKSLFIHYLPDCIYVVVKPEQILANLFELFTKVPKEKAKNMLLITGPSRTADIEKILILGAHGPRRLVVYWLEEK